ncbi:MAG: histidine phosphatase family protein [Clostridiales bacterium]|nr:histidine phosphatase family protein [Clostridiales bacterium]
MTTVYFIRHAQSDNTVRDDRTRPLTAAGLQDTRLITACLSGRGVSRILSSPYTRTIQTVTHLADTLGLPIETDADFREREAGGWHGDNFLAFIRSQWEDFSYHIMDGECLASVQQRNVAALQRALCKYAGETIAIATHGTALSTILNYYDPNWGYDSFMRILDVMPYVVRLDFDESGKRVGFEEVLMVQKQWRKV